MSTYSSPSILIIKHMSKDRSIDINILSLDKTFTCISFSTMSPPKVALYNINGIVLVVGVLKETSTSISPSWSTCNSRLLQLSGVRSNTHSNLCLTYVSIETPKVTKTKKGYFWRHLKWFRWSLHSFYNNLFVKYCYKKLSFWNFSSFFHFNVTIIYFAQPFCHLRVFTGVQ